VALWFARILVQRAHAGNCRISYGCLKTVPKNYRNSVGPKLGGDGVAVVRNNFERATVLSLQVRTFSSKAGFQKETTRGSDVKISPNFNDNITVNIKSISNLQNLVAAYELIKSNPGNLTPGVGIETLDGITLDYLKSVQSALKSGTFKFKPARRTHIPKPGKSETRPLTIASPREKIVQKAMQLVMEQKYEPKFLDTSHGFRPQRGSRTAMQYIDAKFQSVHYVIEADFKQAFPSIPHDKLLSILKEQIHCDKTLSLIKSSLKAGYIEFGELHNNALIGTPQGSILSPLLCNIFLSKLDEFMMEIKQEFDKGTKRSRSKEYQKIQNRVKYMRMKGLNVTDRAQYEALLKMMRTISSISNDNSYNRIHYVRFADDFIIGVEGSYELASIVLKKVSNFVTNNLNLQLNSEKTGIVKYSKKPVKFLGYNLIAPHRLGISKAIETVKSGDRLIARRKKVRIRINMDVQKVISRLIANGYIRKRTSHQAHSTLIYRGRFKGNLINLDHADIIRRYNEIIRGLYNYYDFVKNINDL
jgi:group II intron reverse transcriptase/maturase